MASPRHKVGIIVGSLRRDSINRKIAKSIAAFTSEWLDCDLLDIGDLPLLHQHDEGNPTPTVGAFRDRVRAADGIMFVTPEYNRGVPGALKNAIDIGSRPYGQSVWDKKPAAVVTVSPSAIGGFGSNHHLRQYGVFLNMPMMQQPEAYLGQVGDGSFAESGRLKDGPLKDVVINVAHAFANWIDLIVRGGRLIAEDAAHSAKS